MKTILILNRPSSVAPMQELMRWGSENSRDKSARFDFGWIKCGEVLRIRSTEPFNLVDVDRF
jgi:hypothetical protein